MIIERTECFSSPELKEGMRVKCLETWAQLYTKGEIYVLKLHENNKDLVIPTGYNGHCAKWKVLDLARPLLSIEELL